ncbi:FAD-binding protein [Kribbella turkmenica]|uniref:FAD-binding protein n=1 Tax=Kribbella turkmenica TaxID=2530375 RepID=A0A4V6PDC9_9ACTN|nr:FAD-dependent monooxygenase [Kribbella turkmenica]TDD29907.1 FAD-binding protein [Kribbella turkmenica]
MGSGEEASTAIIIGAGIGGLVAAVGLRRAGWSVTVLERAPVIAEVGAGLTLWPNAERALDTLGIEIRSRAVPTISRGSLRTPTGRWLRRSHPMDVGVLAMHRADLHDVLRKRLPETALHTDAEVVSVSPKGVVVCRCGGEENELTADLVVAADGVNSVTRRTLWSGDPVFQGRTVWRGVTPPGSVWPVEESLTLGRGVQAGVLPLPDERVYWFVTVNADRPNQSYADNRREALHRVGDWHHPIPALIATTPEDQVLHNDVVDIDPVPTFVNERVVLLGDAAHAMPPDLGQGACQAIEDAVVLAACLSSGDGLQKYDDLRRARVHPMAEAARASVRRTSNTGLLAHLTVAVTARMIPPSAWRNATAQWSDWSPPELPKGKNKHA